MLSLFPLNRHRFSGECLPALLSGNFYFAGTADAYAHIIASFFLMDLYNRRLLRYTANGDQTASVCFLLSFHTEGFIPHGAGSDQFVGA